MRFIRDFILTQTPFALLIFACWLLNIEIALVLVFILLIHTMLTYQAFSSGDVVNTGSYSMNTIDNKNKNTANVEIFKNVHVSKEEQSSRANLKGKPISKRKGLDHFFQRSRLEWFLYTLLWAGATYLSVKYIF
jgi:hypothetical protein